ATALGVPLCQRHVTTLGGSIELDSLPDFCPTVTVALPLREARDATALSNGPRERRRNATALASPQLQVLVAEDQPAN
ncbi:hypothetical protein AAHH79_42620, partial [Burkholderia pseudomallei]